MFVVSRAELGVGALTAFRIVSATATDVVALGDARDHVRDVLGEFRTFRRTPASEEADHFVESGAMATYSADGALVLLELAEPATVEVDGVQLLGMELDALETSLGDQGLEVVLDDAGATIPSMQVGLFAPGGTVEGVSLGSD